MIFPSVPLCVKAEVCHGLKVTGLLFCKTKDRRDRKVDECEVHFTLRLCKWHYYKQTMSIHSYRMFINRAWRYFTLAEVIGQIYQVHAESSLSCSCCNSSCMDNEDGITICVAYSHIFTFYFHHRSYEEIWTMSQFWYLWTVDILQMNTQFTSPRLWMLYIMLQCRASFN